MQLIALLTSVQPDRVRRALAPGDQLAPVTTWDSLVRRLADADTGLVFLNPAVADAHGPTADGRHTAVTRLQTIPFVLYVKAADLRSSMAFVRGGAADVMLEGISDSPAEIQAALRNAQVSPAEMVFRHVAAAIPDRHAGVRAVIAELFRAPDSAVTAGALAKTSGIPARTLYRVMSAAGLAPLAVIADGACDARVPAPAASAAHTGTDRPGGRVRVGTSAVAAPAPGHRNAIGGAGRCAFRGNFGGSRAPGTIRRRSPGSRLAPMNGAPAWGGG